MAWLKRRIEHLAALVVHKFDRFLLWLFATQNPAVITVREFIRNNRVLLMWARIVMRFVRHFPRWAQNWTRSWFATLPQRRLQSVMAARAIGGAITSDDLDLIWATIRMRQRVLYIATGLERNQIESVLAAACAKGVSYLDLDPDRAASIDGDRFDLIIATPVPGLEPRIAEMRGGMRRAEAFLAVGQKQKRSEYFEIWNAQAQSRGAPETVSAGTKKQGDPLRVVFLNDVGFQYGAGIALKRQAASFLLNGSEVHIVAWNPGETIAPPVITGVAKAAGWGGFHALPHCHHGRGMAPERIVSEVIATIRDLKPDVIITGNLHGTDWPVTLIQQLKTIDAPVFAYMHDCYWATGRCAYPVSCHMYEVGCNETCPTPNEYPKLPPPQIATAWSLKGDIFGHATGIPLVTNSDWTSRLARRRYGQGAKIACVHLAVDHELFAPMDKAFARRLLGLPIEGDIIVMGAVDILNKWKGGKLFRAIHSALHGRRDVSLVLFGHSSGMLRSTRSFGAVEDERLLPLILNSADIFVGTATEEAFGQTLLEASACGIPVVAFDVGGVSDVVVNEETGLLVKELNVSALYAAIERLLSDRSLRERLGGNARRRVEARFTLTKQSDAWMSYIASQPMQSDGAPAISTVE